MKALAYCRVSTARQEDEGLSLPAQRAKLEAYCALNTLELLAIHEDALSGKDAGNRPGLQALLARLEAGEAQAVVVIKLDRLARKTRDTLELIERFDRQNVAFHSVNERIDTRSALGRFFLTIVAAFAEMERALIVERTLEVLAYKQKNGEHVGGVPFGFRSVRVDGATHLAIDPDTYPTLAEILVLREEGLSCAGIASVLNVRGIPTRCTPRKVPRETRWHAGTIQQLLARTPGKEEA